MYQGKMLHRSQAAEISPPLAQLSLTCDFRHRNLNTPRASAESEGHPGIMCIVRLPICLQSTHCLVAARRRLAWFFGSYFSRLRRAGKLHAARGAGKSFDVIPRIKNSNGPLQAVPVMARAMVERLA